MYHSLEKQICFLLLLTTFLQSGCFPIYRLVKQLRHIYMQFSNLRLTILQPKIQELNHTFSAKFPKEKWAKFNYLFILFKLENFEAIRTLEKWKKQVFPYLSKSLTYLLKPFSKTASEWTWRMCRLLNLRNAK